MTKSSKAVQVGFDYSLDFKRIDSRERPELYRIGRGEQGGLLVEPYKVAARQHPEYVRLKKDHRERYEEK